MRKPPVTSTNAQMEDDRGSVSAFVIAIITIAVLMTALMVDGGSIRNSRRDAGNIAQQAARAAAQQVDQNHFLANEEITLDPSQARRAAQTVISTEGATGTIAVAGNSVTVTVTKPVSLILLGNDRTVSATRTVDAFEGT